MNYSTVEDRKDILHPPMKVYTAYIMRFGYRDNLSQEVLETSLAHQALSVQIHYQSEGPNSLKSLAGCHGCAYTNILLQQQTGCICMSTVTTG